MNASVRRERTSQRERQQREGVEVEQHVRTSIGVEEVEEEDDCESEEYSVGDFPVGPETLSIPSIDAKGSGICRGPSGRFTSTGSASGKEM